MIGERCYPKSLLARVVVKLLDRLPEHAREQVLNAYWSPSDVERVRQDAERLWARFGQPRIEE